MTARFRRLFLILVLLSLPLAALLARSSEEELPDLISYVLLTCDEGFEERKYSAEDALVFSRLSYEPFQLLGTEEPYTIRTAYEELSALGFEDEVLIEWDDELLEACAESERYADVQILAFVSDTDLSIDKQFSAVTFALPADLYFVSFRGTDNTVVGWKEDFNMSFTSPVPAQEEAVAYISAVMEEYPGTFVVTGHSKGGNLAMFSSSFVSEGNQERIAEIFSFDGPGFPDEVLAYDGYQRVRERIRLYVPESSVIGMLLSRDLDYTAVRSSALSGFRQHDIYTWLIGEACTFETVSEVDEQSRYFDQTIRSTLETLDEKEREELTDLIFSLAEETGKSTFASMKEEFMKSALAIVRGFSELEEDEQDMLFSGLKSLAENAFSNLKILLPQKLDRE